MMIKTIKMTQATLDKWLEALRSGEYEQTKGKLYKSPEFVDLHGGTVGYCCLGVLQHCLTGETEKYENGEPLSLPSIDWLSKHGISFYQHGYPNTRQSRPWVSLGHKWNPLDYLNDTHVPFEVIADLIENHVEVIGEETSADF